MKFLFIVSSLAILFMASAYPWGDEGHQAIGEAARTMLTADARSEIQKLLGNDDLAVISVWLDDVRNLAHHHSATSQLLPFKRRLKSSLLSMPNRGWLALDNPSSGA
jgi:S1/P1 Nuclease